MNLPAQFATGDRIARRRRALLAVEPVEPRLMMTAGLGFIGGYATHAAGAPDTAATIQLFDNSGSTTPIATTTPTAPDGYFHFDGLTPGTYTVNESEAGYTSTAAAATTTINPASAIDNNTAFQVTVVNPSAQAVTVTNGKELYTPATTYYTVTGAPFDSLTSHGDTTHQYNLSLVGNQGNAHTIVSLCTDVYHGIGAGAVYPTTPSLTPQATNPDITPTTSAANLGRIGYLYNHIGQFSTNDPVAGAGLSLAIWELLYDTTDDLKSGNFQLVPGKTDPAIVAAANGYLAASVGRSEEAYFLNVSPPSGSVAGQSMIATDLLRFTNTTVTPAIVTPASINGTVFEDFNADCVQQTAAGESGLAGVIVTLTNANGGPVTDLGNHLVGPATTDAAGHYAFGNLSPGTYVVTEGSIPAADGTFAHEGQTSTTVAALTGVARVVSNIVLKAGDTSTDNFCEAPLSTINGVVFRDLNGDCVQQVTAGESGLANVPVTLKNAAGTVLATAATDASGSYSFPGLAPGNYSVVEGAIPAADGVFSHEGQASTTAGAVTGVPRVVSHIALTYVSSTDNFCEVAAGCSPCSITGLSYTDLGPCGITTFGDLGGNTHQGDQVTANFTVTGCSPVTLTLVTYTTPSNFDLTQQRIFSVNTETLATGKHSLTVTIPNSYYQIDLVCGAAISQFNPSAGVTYHGQNRFIDSDNGGSELAGGGLGSLSGTVYDDANNNGLIGAGEFGLGGVTVKLTGTDALGHAVANTRVTAADGSYSFAGLQPGTYKVTEVQPTGYLDGLDSRNNVVIAGSNGSDAVAGIVVTAATDAPGNNFGEIKATPAPTPTPAPVGCTTGAALASGQTATIGFWHNKNGQALINGLNGGPNARALGNWLACNFPNMYGNLAGQTNAQVAATFQALFNQSGAKVGAQVLATALAVYATDSDLAGGSMAASCGFTVNTHGTGASTFTVTGAVASSCGLGTSPVTATIYQALAFVNQTSSHNVLASGNSTLLNLFNTVFDGINQGGDIS